LWVLPLSVLVPAWAFLLAFFRDPHRVIPADIDALVSPADGVITHLEEVGEPAFPTGRAFRVSIFLSVFNVHVNRAPRPGLVRRVRYYPGEFLDARSQGCHVRNEQLWIDFEDERLGCPVRVKQIAGAVARRIVCWLAVGEKVQAGDRLGMIKFGSRTDVLVPADAVGEVLVRVGQAVQGGSTVLLRLKTRPG
jgi:phosphatidylserine decarboxylase